MGFQEAIRSGFNNYANFSDRSSRSEFWYWALFQFLLEIVFYILVLITPIALVLLLVFLAIIVPSIAVSVRRLHDSGKSGWNLLWTFVPFGGLYLLYLYFQPSDGPNAYGDGPLTA